MAQAELEIRIRTLQSNGYPVELRYSPDGEQDQVIPDSGPVFAKFDVDKLFGLVRQPAEYGKALGAMLFADLTLQKAVAMIWGPVRGGATLRVRLFLDHGAEVLQDVNWEAMCDTDGYPLFLGAKVWFSRYLTSDTWQPVKVRAKTELKALVVIANPSDLANLPPINTEGETNRAKDHLTKAASITFLGRGIPDAKAASVANISQALGEGYDILYLIAHGAFSDQGQPKLWLEDDKTGATDFVVGDRLSQAIRNLSTAPRLVMLASCMSFASVEDEPEKVYSALGPQLAAAGVPAVIAMHGKVSQDTIAKFVPEFYNQLAVDGQIDRAVSIARGQIADTQKDYWMPVLFMRLRSGMLWYTPGFGDTANSDRLNTPWKGIKGAIKYGGECLPILGPGVIEDLVGSSRDIARRLADANHFPLAPYSREDLPTVAQYLAIRENGAKFPRRALAELLEDDIRTRFASILTPADLAGDINDLISAVGRYRRKTDPNNPHSVLASKPFAVYLTATPDRLMEDALIEAGKNPRTDFARWNDEIADINTYPTVSDDGKYTPDVKNPLVYHLYGRFDVLQDSLVVAEDDYFDFLLRISSKADAKSLVPSIVQRALTRWGLLFIGFQLDEWGFRVLLRSIYSKEGSGARNVGTGNPSVGAQVVPSEERVLSPARTKQYFEKYLQSSNISLYWGNVREFIDEFRANTA